jgi:hypothetical protein
VTLAPAYYASVIKKTTNYRYYLGLASPHKQGLSGLVDDFYADVLAGEKATEANPKYLY